MVFRRALFLAPFLIIACSPPDTSGIILVGHGGMGAYAEFPMDGQEALLGGLEHGFAGVEMDVQITADGVLVAYHDENMVGPMPCVGHINSRTWSELSTCDLDGSRLVRLDRFLPEALEKYPNAEFTLDVKLFAAGDWWTYLEQISDSIAVLSRLPLLKAPLLVECQVEDLLKLVERKAPEIATYYYATNAEQGIATAKESGCDGITIAHDRIHADEVTAAHRQGLSVTLFGVGGNWSLRRAVGKGPNRIQSDIAP